MGLLVSKAGVGEIDSKIGMKDSETHTEMMMKEVLSAETKKDQVKRFIRAAPKSQIKREFTK